MTSFCLDLKTDQPIHIDGDNYGDPLVNRGCYVTLRINSDRVMCHLETATPEQLMALGHRIAVEGKKLATVRDMATLNALEPSTRELQTSNS